MAVMNCLMHKCCCAARPTLAHRAGPGNPLMQQGQRTPQRAGPENPLMQQGQRYPSESRASAALTLRPCCAMAMPCAGAGGGG